MHGMNNRENESVDENEWRKLCDLIASERDPERLSQLVTELLNELDARRKKIQENEGV
jgi:hypothetical protein